MRCTEKHFIDSSSFDNEKSVDLLGSSIIAFPTDFVRDFHLMRFSELVSAYGIWPELGRLRGQQRSSRAKNYIITFLHNLKQSNARTYYFPSIRFLFSRGIYFSRGPHQLCHQKMSSSQITNLIAINTRTSRNCAGCLTDAKRFSWVSRYGMNLLRSCQLQIKLESARITWGNVIFSLEFNKKFSR